MRRVLNATPGWTDVTAAHDLDDGTIDAILSQAEQLATGKLGPVGLASDTEGCRFEDGRVKVPECYHDAFAALAGGG